MRIVEGARRVEPERQPQVRTQQRRRCTRLRGQLEAGRHYADHLIRLLVDADRGPDHVWITAKPSLPVSVGKHDDRGPIWVVVGLLDQAAQ